MILETVKAEGLAHLSYLLGDEEAGVCAVIDPRRDMGIYLELARENHVRITHVLETHIHADFVSGSRELAAKTGARIGVGAEAGADASGFEHRPLHGGDMLELGSLTLKVLHTPGHTPEHVCFLVSGGKGAQAPWAVFTGDTLFAGEVGRPDLLGDGSEETLARQLFHSLREKLLPLGDDVEVYPAHGAGSPCGGSIGDRNATTIGYERRCSPHLQARDEETFVSNLLSSLPPAPAYYPRMKKINAAGPEVKGDAPLLLLPIDAAQFAEEAKGPDALVLDTREIEAFGGGHIAGALNIALRPQEFALWAGWMLRPEQRILLVLPDDSQARSAARHLFRIGIENIAGYLRRGMRGWFEAGLPFETLPQMSVHALREHIHSTDEYLTVLDVRRRDEWEEKGHIPAARHRFAGHLPQHLSELDRDKAIAVYCASGYRASVAASLLKREGFARVHNVPGSFSAWEAAGFEVEKGRQ